MIDNIIRDVYEESFDVTISNIKEESEWKVQKENNIGDEEFNNDSSKTLKPIIREIKKDINSETGFEKIFSKVNRDNEKNYNYNLWEGKSDYNRNYEKEINKDNNSMSYKKVFSYLNNKSGYEILESSLCFINYIDGVKKIYEICNFNIVAEEIIIKDDDLITVKEYKIKCILLSTNECKNIYLNARDLNCNNWISGKLGIKYCLKATFGAYDYLKNYMAEQFKLIEEKIEYIHIGWRKISNKFVYLHGGGAIGSNLQGIKGDSTKVIKILSNKSRQEVLREALYMINISDKYSKTLPLLLYSHLSVMKEVFVKAGVEPHFILWIYGLTGSMKTSVAKVFFNIFNRDKEYLTATFKDTKTAIEIKSTEYKDSVLVVDDYHPTTSTYEKREMQSLASNILRIYGDGIAKSRSNKSLEKAKEFPPRGMCVITGEDIIGGESSVARFIGIEVASGDYKTEELSYHQRNPLLFSTHIYYFIEWVSNNFEIIINHIKNYFQIYRNEISNLYRHKRLCDSYAILILTKDILVEYCRSIIDINQEEIMRVLDYSKEIIQDVIKFHENSTTKEDPAILYLIAIQELLISKRCRVIKNGEEYNNNNIIGFEDDEFYYLIPNIAYNFVREFWRGQAIEFPVGSEAVNKALDELKVIKTSIESNSVKRTVKATMNNNRKRFLIINKECMSNIINKL